MLKFYGNSISPNSRRVWLTLLEKDIAFEWVVIRLDGDQLQPAFLEINPFHHIPAVVEDGFKVIESLAILDYLEAKHPAPALLPTNAKDLAIVRMVQQVTANELFPPMISLIINDSNSPQVEQATQKIAITLDCLTRYLGERPYFGSQYLTLADIVAGVLVPLLPRLGVSLAPHQTIDRWYQRLMERESWQKAQLSTDDFELFKRRVRAMVILRQRSLRDDQG